MCFVGKSEGSAKANSRKASSRKAPSRERDWVGGVWVFASLDAIECEYCIVSCAVTSLDGGGGEPLVPGGGHKNFSLSYSYIISRL